MFHLFSLGGNILDFGTPVTLVSTGTTFGGLGTPLAVAGTTVSGTSDGGGFDSSGTIQLFGTFTAITVTPTVVTISDGSGFIFGVQAVPEPASLALIGVGAAGLVARRLRRR